MLPAALYWVLSYSGFYISATPARAALHTMPILMMVNQLVSVSLPHMCETLRAHAI